MHRSASDKRPAHKQHENGKRIPHKSMLLHSITLITAFSCLFECKKHELAFWRSAWYKKNGKQDENSWGTVFSSPNERTIQWKLLNMCASHVCFFSSSSNVCIAEAKAVVVGPTDIYVKMGSEVILTCIVSQGPHELGTIYWYRGKHSSCKKFQFAKTFTRIEKSSNARARSR